MQIQSAPSIASSANFVLVPSPTPQSAKSGAASADTLLPVNPACDTAATPPVSHPLDIRRGEVNGVQGFLLRVGKARPSAPNCRLSYIIDLISLRPNAPSLPPVDKQVLAFSDTEDVSAATDPVAKFLIPWPGASGPHEPERDQAFSALGRYLEVRMAVRTIDALGRESERSEALRVMR